MNDNRCMFIEGIGRVHVLGPRNDPYVTVADTPELSPGLFTQADFDRAMLAADIVAGQAEGKILWSVRFREKARPHA